MASLRSHPAQIFDNRDIGTAYPLICIANFFVGPIYKEVTARHGIARSEFAAIFCLHNLGSLTAQDICAINGFPKNSVSQAVAKLLERDLIRRQTDRADARRAPLALTARGARLYEQIIPLFRERETGLLATLTAAERRQLRKLLLKLAVRDDDWAALY